MAIQEYEQLTPREHVLMEVERDENRLIREHAEQMKRFELAVEREKNQAEIQLKKLEAKWASWLSLPKIVVKLPIYSLLGIGYIIHAFRKEKPSEAFWDFINK